MLDELCLKRMKLCSLPALHESYSVLILGDILQTFDVVATPKPINVAYSSVNVHFHMDLVYYESPPGLQLLFAFK